MSNEKFKPLPLAGTQLVKLRFCGNGKDSEVTIQTRTSARPSSPLAMRRWI